MSIIKDTRNLVLGNGDLFLTPLEASLPTRSTYKSAYNAGTVAQLTGNVGAVKGTVSVQIVREIVHFEVGVPQEIVDQTVIREGIHLKCSLAEMDLVTVKTALGIPDADYSTTTAGSTLVTAEAFTPHFSTEGEPVATPIQKAPVLFTTSTPAASADPVVTENIGHTTCEIDVDYIIDTVTNTLTPLKDGKLDPTKTGQSAVTGSITYYYNQASVQVMTGGGRSSLQTSALGFFHPYKDGRCSALFLPNANPAGSITLPFEEIAYGHYEFEMRAIADFTRPMGQHLYRMEREMPV